jgi:hypothetical protein
LIPATGPLRLAAGTVRGDKSVDSVRIDFRPQRRPSLADTTGDPLDYTENDVPLLCFDLIQGRSENQIKTILDATHEVLIQSFAVPERDRYQIVREHPPSRMIVEDSGLGIKRTPNMLVLQVTTRPRRRTMEQAFYSSLVKKLETSCGIAPSDVIVTFVTNTDEDWSFGLGRAQFLTGEL